MKNMKLPLKSNLNMAADARALQSDTFLTCLLPSTAIFVVKAKEAGQKYNKLVQATGKNHEFGPPHVHVWAAVVVEATKTVESDIRRSMLPPQIRQ